MKLHVSRDITIALLLFVGSIIHADSNDHKTRYDYIIVGGGAAGCILARKLSDNGCNSVLMLEAGGNYIDDPVTLDPNWLDNALTLIADPKFSLVYPVAFPPLTLYSYSEGHELGGGGAHNFLLTVRGTPSIYNEWEAITGNAKWSYYGNVLRLMKSLETYTPDGTVANPAERGTKGPISVTQGQPLDPTNPYLSALSTVTLTPFISDYNDPSLGDIGISAVQQFITSGAGSHRSFSALEFLSPVIDANGKGINGRKLKVITNAQVLDIRINSQMRATSVHYTVQNNEKHEIEYELIKASLTKNTGTLILAAGSVQTPNLLLQSGVGPAADLEAIGISVVLDSPNVGQNLQCQYGGSAILTGTVPFGAEAFIDAYPFMPNDGVRRIQIIHLPIASPESIEDLPLILDPQSRGSITRTTNNPFIQPKVDIGLFTDGSVSTPGTDAYLQVSFYKIIQAAAALAGATVIYPTPAQFASDADLLNAALGQLTIQSHIVGTAKMGTNISNGVVDGNLKVFGLENVYIGDNSAQPKTSNGNVCYPAYIIALVLCQVFGIPTPPAL